MSRGGGEFNPLCRTLARTAWLTASTMAALLLHMQLSSEWLTSCIAVTDCNHWSTVHVSHCFWCCGKTSKPLKSKTKIKNLTFDLRFVTRRFEILGKNGVWDFSRVVEQKKTEKHKCTLRMNMRPVNSLKLLINQWCHAVTLVYNTQTPVWHKTCSVMTDGHVLPSRTRYYIYCLFYCFKSYQYG